MSAEPVPKVIAIEAAPARGFSPAAPLAFGCTRMLRVLTPGGGGVSASTSAPTSSSFALNITPCARAGSGIIAPAKPTAAATRRATMERSDSKRFMSISSLARLSYKAADARRA
jgi:hypothetical protein